MNLRAALSALALFTAISFPVTAQITVSTTAELRAAVANATDGSRINLAATTFELDSPLRVRSGVELVGAGAGQTTLRAAPSWQANFTGSIDDGANFERLDPNSYLIDLGRDDSVGAAIRDMTLTGPNLHGAVAGITSHGLQLSGLEVRDFGWSGVRLFVTNDVVIENSSFINAGGVSPGGPTGGALNLTFLKDSTIRNNRFEKEPGFNSNFYGIKGRQFRDTAISNNTILTNFAIELPFEIDRRVEINNNYLDGVVSVPRFNGGETPITDGGDSFHIYNNYFTRAYSIEGPHNALRIEQNLFDIEASDDGGNLISTFDSERSDTIPGPVIFTDNLVKNPGRGVFWSGIPYDNLEFSRNHIIADETIPYTLEGGIPPGLFGFRVAQDDGDATDFSTITISDNIIEVIDLDDSDGVTTRDLLRNLSSADANIVNNLLSGISDTERYSNEQTGAAQGPATPLFFRVGADGEFLVDGFSISEVPVPEPTTGVVVVMLGVLTLRRRASLGTRKISKATHQLKP